jgi:hypothetical protein
MSSIFNTSTFQQYTAPQSTTMAPQAQSLLLSAKQRAENEYLAMKSEEAFTWAMNARVREIQNMPEFRSLIMTHFSADMRDYVLRKYSDEIWLAASSIVNRHNRQEIEKLISSATNIAPSHTTTLVQDSPAPTAVYVHPVIQPAPVQEVIGAPVPAPLPVAAPKAVAVAQAPAAPRKATKRAAVTPAPTKKAAVTPAPSTTQEEDVPETPAPTATQEVVASETPSAAATQEGDVTPDPAPVSAPKSASAVSSAAPSQTKSTVVKKSKDATNHPVTDTLKKLYEGRPDGDNFYRGFKGSIVSHASHYKNNFVNIEPPAIGGGVLKFKMSRTKRVQGENQKLEYTFILAAEYDDDGTALITVTDANGKPAYTVQTSIKQLWEDANELREICGELQGKLFGGQPRDNE